MYMFLVAYLVVWAALLGYVVRLAAAQRRLRNDLESLQRQVERLPDNALRATHAA
jgi:CcmD family protein